MRRFKVTIVTRNTRQASSSAVENTSSTRITIRYEVNTS